MLKLSSVLVLSSLVMPALAMAQASMSVEQKIAAALKGEHRTEAELARDADRDPMAALQFIGLRDDMTVSNFCPQHRPTTPKSLDLFLSTMVT